MSSNFASSSNYIYSRLWRRDHAIKSQTQGSKKVQVTASWLQEAFWTVWKLFNLLGTRVLKHREKLQQNIRKLDVSNTHRCQPYGKTWVAYILRPLTLDTMITKRLSVTTNWKSITEWCVTNFTRCMYLQCMPRANLNTLWTNTCTLVRDGQPCATKCEQCEKDGKAYVERVWGIEWGFERHFPRRPWVSLIH